MRDASISGALLLMSMVLAGVCAAGGSAQEEMVFRTRRLEVVIPVSVDTKSGSPMTGLSVDDFVVKDQGRPQRVVAVREIDGSPQSKCNVPSAFLIRSSQLREQVRAEKAVWIDTENLEFREIRESVAALVEAFGVEGQEKPRLTYISDRRGLSVVENLWEFNVPPGLEKPREESGMRARIDRVMAAIAIAGDQPDKSFSGTPELLIRRSLRRLRELAAELSLQPGKKQLLWVGGGFNFTYLLSCCTTQWYVTLSKLNDANVEVSGLDGGGVRLPPGFSASIGARASRGMVLGRHPGGSGYSRAETDALRILAAETGGRFYGNSNDLVDAYRQFLSLTPHFYEVTIVPGQTWFDGKRHSFDVKVKKRGVRVRHRRSYMAVQPEAILAISFESRLQTASESLADAGTLCLGGRAEVAAATDGERLSLAVWIGGAGLKLAEEEDGKFRGAVRLLIIQSDRAGKELARKDLTVRLTLGAKEYAQFRDDGLVIAQEVAKAEGAASALLIGGHEATDQIGSVRIPIR